MIFVYCSYNFDYQRITPPPGNICVRIWCSEDSCHTTENRAKLLHF